MSPEQLWRDAFTWLQVLPGPVAALPLALVSSLAFLLGIVSMRRFTGKAALLARFTMLAAMAGALLGLLATLMWSLNRIMDGIGTTPALGVAQVLLMLVMGLVVLAQVGWPSPVQAPIDGFSAAGMLIWLVAGLFRMMIMLPLELAARLSRLTVRLISWLISGRYKSPQTNKKHWGFALALNVAVSLLPSNFRMKLGVDIRGHAEDAEQEECPADRWARLGWTLGVAIDLLKLLVAAWLAELIPDWLQALVRLVTGR